MIQLGLLSAFALLVFSTPAQALNKAFSCVSKGIEVGVEIQEKNKVIFKDYREKWAWTGHLTTNGCSKAKSGYKAFCGIGGADAYDPNTPVPKSIIHFDVQISKSLFEKRSDSGSIIYKDDENNPITIDCEVVRVH